MLARKKERLEALRSVKAAFTLAKSEKRADYKLTEDEELKIIKKLVKQRKDSAAIYKQQNREDLFENEEFEAGVIAEFMPEQMDESELRKFLEDLIKEMGAESMQQMGQVMGRATKELSGKADGKMISQIVRELLN